MNKLSGVPRFSEIVCLPSFKGDNKKGVITKLSPIGKVVDRNLRQFHKIFPEIEIWRQCIMPDHIHFLLNVNRIMDKRLGEYLAVLKRMIFRECVTRKLVTSQNSIFEKGFNDQFLRRGRSLDIIKTYIDENPWRHWEIKNKREFFGRTDELYLYGVKCKAYGNLHLLDNPFIESVVIHRRYSDKEKKERYDRWRYCLMNGGVLAGAYIAKEEKKIKEGILRWGGKMILISNEYYDDREKPSGELFQHCAKGNLLIISPLMDISREDPKKFRKECLLMNELSGKIARQERE